MRTCTAHASAPVLQNHMLCVMSHLRSRRPSVLSQMAVLTCYSLLRLSCRQCLMLPWPCCGLVWSRPRHELPVSACLWQLCAMWTRRCACMRRRALSLMCGGPSACPQALLLHSCDLKLQRLGQHMAEHQSIPVGIAIRSSDLKIYTVILIQHTTTTTSRLIAPNNYPLYEFRTVLSNLFHVFHTTYSLLKPRVK